MESQLVDSRIHRLILSSHRLSPKSLELCTENLGNETGSDIIESGIELLSSHSSECGDGEVSPGMIREKRERKAREGRSFPPPLTTITGSESIRVRPHREGGRLVLQLIKVPSSFRAERSPGRLRLCFWTEMQHHHHHHIEDAVEDDQEDEKHTKERKQRQQVRVESTKFEWPSSRPYTRPYTRPLMDRSRFFDLDHSFSFTSREGGGRMVRLRPCLVPCGFSRMPPGPTVGVKMFRLRFLWDQQRGEGTCKGTPMLKLGVC
ncbi:hypothetical protein LR48_Vigan303s001800 [Vigna angularis]|uniref:FAF domain-containing protein n=1 Tax=Phaseolus angularis TaxID=3914 RepID=A0A0L9T8C1_PHAAN|nr:hypothetical protein LR48_Vigan303s001800 [Vigna angularis]